MTKIKIALKIILISILLAVTIYLSFRWGESNSRVDIAISDDDSEEAQETEEAVRELMALPYLEFDTEVADLNLSGTMYHDQDFSYQGYNLYDNKLIDMEGNLVRKWDRGTLVTILPSGNVGMRCGPKFCLESWNGSLMWEIPYPIHHEIAYTTKGTILTYTLDTPLDARGQELVYNGRKVQFDVMIEINESTGETIRKWSTWDNLQELQQYHESLPLDKKPLDRRFEVPKGEDLRKTIVPTGRSVNPLYDYYHLNSIQELPHNALENDSRFRQGNILISSRHISKILILDQDTLNVVWEWGEGELDGQHMPRMIENGHITIFDNGDQRRFSRVIEINPVSKEIIWEFKDPIPETFYTKIIGGTHRLPNGNTIITEGQKGHVFEVTSNGDIVWDWWNPEINSQNNRQRVYRMVRLNKEFIDNLE